MKWLLIITLAHSLFQGHPDWRSELRLGFDDAVACRLAALEIAYSPDIESAVCSLSAQAK